jgi:hypothetical protein
MEMNRRSFIRSLAIGGAAVAIAPNLSFASIEEENQVAAERGALVIVQIFWPNMKKQKLNSDSVYLDLGSTSGAEFLVFEMGVFKSMVEPMLKEDKVKYQVD